MKSIIIIEQNKNYAKVLELLFRDHYNVKVYHLGMDFLDELTTLRPDIILINYALPDIFGLQVVKKIRERFKTVPVIVHDEESSSLIEVHCLDLGANAFVAQGKSGEHRLYQKMVELMKKHEPNYPKKAAKLVLSLFGLAFLISA
jgi:DNA-binding response OmpR family regulator